MYESAPYLVKMSDSIAKLPLPVKGRIKINSKHSFGIPKKLKMGETKSQIKDITPLTLIKLTAIKIAKMHGKIAKIKEKDSFAPLTKQS